jgi:hypothetical protein
LVAHPAALINAEDEMAVAPRLNDTLRHFIEAREMFFVATAAPEGRVNLSPKGLDTLRVIADDRIVWLSLSGSGNETAAHLLQSDRMTLMFCAFSGDARILRVYGHARTLYPRDGDFAGLAALFPQFAGTRQIFDLTIDQVQTSCGSGVPMMTFSRERGDEELVPFFAKMRPEEMEAYWRRKNSLSIDGQPTGILP